MLYENKYEISPDGTIRDLEKELTLIPFKVSKDRKALFVMLNGKRKQVARLIYELFSGNKLSSNEMVLFKDDNYKNCSFENLYVMSRQEYKKENVWRLIDDNMATEIKNRYLLENMGCMPAPGKRVNLSVKALAKEYGISTTSVLNIINGK